MIVTSLEEYTKNKYKVYLDGQFAFVLYKGELHRYGIELNKEISSDDYDAVMEEVIVKRAKKRVMYLLKSMDRTEGELRQKLKEGMYPKQACDIAIEYVKGYKYVDDERYADRYIEYKSSSKSIRQMRAELKNKGLSEEIIDRTLENANTDETSVIIKYIRKRHYDINTADPKETAKLYRYLAGKGFGYNKIEEAFSKIRQGEDI